ncbi:MAG: hypothetical protein CL940_03685 [Deltaproteobacteria bacterium]|nr:hypothetical protein [Deltaproteobacteria bacterium]
MRVVALVQARLASTRLPQKVLADLCGRPMVMHCVERARRAAGVDEVIIATTVEASDDPLEAFCDASSLGVYRGSVDDIVGRLLGAAHARQADAIVRIWADCPMVDPVVIERAVAAVIGGGADYATNSTLAGRTYPVGLDIEVYTTALLERIDRSTDHPFLREMPFEFVREHAPELELAFVRHDEDLSDVHLTVDYPEDLERFRAMLTDLERADRPPDFADAVAWLRAHAGEDVAHLRDVDYTSKLERYREEER